MCVSDIPAYTTSNNGLIRQLGKGIEPLAITASEALSEVTSKRARLKQNGYTLDIDDGVRYGHVPSTSCSLATLAS